jgi:hypothetical protein
LEHSCQFAYSELGDSAPGLCKVSSAPLKINGTKLIFD